MFFLVVSLSKLPMKGVPSKKATSLCVSVRVRECADAVLGKLEVRQETSPKHKWVSPRKVFIHGLGFTILEPGFDVFSQIGLFL